MISGSCITSHFCHSYLTCWYYWFYGIRSYDVEMASNRTTFISWKSVNWFKNRKGTHTHTKWFSYKPILSLRRESRLLLGSGMRKKILIPNYAIGFKNFNPIHFHVLVGSLPIRSSTKMLYAFLVSSVWAITLQTCIREAYG